MESDLTAIFAKNMKAIRKSLGISQEELAKKSGVHRTYIGGVEQGTRNNLTLKTIRQIADALGADPVEMQRLGYATLFLNSHPH